MGGGRETGRGDTVAWAKSEILSQLERVYTVQYKERAREERLGIAGGSDVVTAIFCDPQTDAT